MDFFEEGVQAAMDFRLTSMTGFRHVGGKPVWDVMDSVNGACVCPVVDVVDCVQDTVCSYGYCS